MVVDEPLDLRRRRARSPRRSRARACTADVAPRRRRTRWCGASMNPRSIQPRVDQQRARRRRTAADPTSAAARRCCVAAIGGLGRARIDDDDRPAVRVLADALPHDRVRDAEVGADEHHHVRLLEVGVGVGRGVEAERLLVRDDRGRHALARVAVAVEHPHPELRERAQERQLLGGNLPGAQERDRLRVRASRWMALKRVDHRAERLVPASRHQLAARVAQQRASSPGRWRASGVSASHPLGQAMPRLTG